MANQILEVSVANAYLKQLLESDEILSDCWIQGEVSERFEARSGHIYFTLTDEQSTLKCVIFRGNALRQRAPFRDGDLVVSHGRLTIYEQRSQYQLIADSVQPAGAGLQALQLELLRQKLESEGLFDESRKRQLPAFPRTIGVVTSADGAVWHDIQHVLARRFPLAHLVLSPAQVQGEGAPASIVNALERLVRSERPDVIIIGRGGGSADDLMAFNDERVVRALFASPIPTVSAVGHETDWTLADLVADLRAPTPSAAAEVVSPSIVELAEYAQALGREVRRLGHAANRANVDSVAQLTLRIRRQSISATVARYRPTIDQATIRIAGAGHARLAKSAADLTALSNEGRHSWTLSAARRDARLDRLAAQLQALDPASVLERGFAIVTDRASGAVLTSVSSVKPGDSATIALKDGTMDATIDAIVPSSDRD